MSWQRLRYLFPSRRRAAEREMEEELASLAQFAGRRELGNLTLAAENARRTWRLTSFDGIPADVRYAFRTLRRQPGFVAVAVLSLAFGIGANSAIFSLADAILLRPLPVSRPAEVLSIGNSTPENAVEGVSYPDYREVRERARSFAGVVAYRSASLGVGITPSAPPQIRLAMMASDNFFSVLGVAPSLGRAFLPEEGKVPGRDRVVILGHDFWRTSYGGERSVIGRTVRLNGIEFTIVGVAPESFPGMDLLFRPALLVPLSMWAQLETGRGNPLENRGLHELSLKGRLGPDARLASARAELGAMSLSLERAFPETNRIRRFAVSTELQARIQQSPMRLGIVVMLMVLVGLVLIIACANVAGLMLARARARSREIAIRLAIGAGRLRLVRQLMIEGVCLSAMGGAAGLVLAKAGMRLFGALEVSSDIPIVLNLSLDTRVLMFTVCATLGSCLIFALAPALQAARTDLVPALKSAWGAVPRGRRRLLGRKTLVVGQIALAMVLLIVAAMFLNGFRKILAMNPGFRTDHLVSMGLDPSVLRYSPAQSYEFYRKLADRVRSLPGVKSVAMGEALPYSPDQAFVSVVPEGYQFPKGVRKARTYGGAFDGNYFQAMGVEILRGRAFTADDRAESRRVAIVNEEFARTYWPGRDAIGRRLHLDGSDGPVAEVVGIAKTGSYLFPTEPPKPYVYLPYEQNQRSRMTLIAETRGAPATLAPQLREAVHSIDADQPVINLRTVASYETRAMSNWLVFLQTFAMMGLVGLMLAMVGLYGLIAYSVSRRTPEIGLRMAIGATRADVFRFVLRQGVTLAAAGIAIGGALAAVIAPALAGESVGPGGNLAGYILVPLALLLVSAAACLVPARRAATLDPVRALRYD
jgi:predicted permease